MVAFTNEAETPSDIDKIDDQCFKNTLSLATTRNKAKMTLFTNLIEARHAGKSNFGKGLKLAFSYFKNSVASINGETRGKHIVFHYFLALLSSFRYKVCYWSLTLELQ